MREIRTSGLMRGYWKRGMGEILWHRRETRRQTEKTNVVLNYRASTLLYRILDEGHLKPEGLADTEVGVEL